MSDEPRCQACGTPWAYHRGCMELSTENLRLTRERDEAREAARAGYTAIAMFRPMNWSEGERARMLMQWPWLEREGEG